MDANKGLQDVSAIEGSSSKKFFILILLIFISLFSLFIVIFLKYRGIIGSNRKYVVFKSDLDNVKISADVQRLEKYLGTWGVWEKGMVVRTIPGYLKAYPVERVFIIIDDGQYKFDLQYEDTVARNKIISSAEETLDGKTLTLRVGIDKDYLSKLMPQEKHEFVSRVLLKTLITLSRIHKTEKELTADIDAWKEIIRREGWFVNIE